MRRMKRKMYQVLSLVLGGFLLLWVKQNYESQNTNLQIDTSWRGPSMESNQDQATNLLFLRTYKTGSTTLYNIFARFAWKNKLSVATYPNNARYTRRQIVENVDKPKEGGKYNFFIEHSRNMPEAFQEIVHQPVVQLSIVRHPLSWLKSFLHYRHLVPVLGLNQTDVVGSFLKKLDDPSWYKRNQKVLDILRSFTTKSLVPNGISTLDKNTLENLENSFFVGITEFFEESVIMFRRKMGWSFKDVLYSPICIQHYPKPTTIDVRLQNRLCRWMSKDCQLYDHFKKTFLDKFQKEDQDIAGEVQHFKSVLKRISQFCEPLYKTIRYQLFDPDGKVFQSQPPLRFSASQWHRSFNYTLKDCALAKLKPEVFRAVFYFKQNPDDEFDRKCPVVGAANLCNKISQYSQDESTMLDKILVEEDAYVWEVNEVSEKETKHKSVHFDNLLA